VAEKVLGGLFYAAEMGGDEVYYGEGFYAFFVFGFFVFLWRERG
jgi:hypothetical protein